MPQLSLEVRVQSWHHSRPECFAIERSAEASRFRGIDSLYDGAGISWEHRDARTKTPA